MHDVYLYGMIAASTVHVLDLNLKFPKPNCYAEISQTLPSIGGEAANSAIMLSKLGVKTKLDGNWLGEENAEKILTILGSLDIDVSRLTVTTKYRGAEEIVIADRTSRTVFGNYAALHAGEKQWNTPHEADVQAAKYVSLDPYFRQESVEVAKICMDNRKPYVTVDCTYDSLIAGQAEAVIISHELRDQAYKNLDLKDVFRKYQRHCGGLIIFTFGAKDLWYARGLERVRTFKPFPITPVDPTGAGDSFRSGVIYGLLKSWDDASTIEFASAVSACVCLTTPHTLNAPNLKGVLDFMNKSRRQHVRRANSSSQSKVLS
jgi:sugar/nucleoside kinase (ribokinase family)